MKSLEPAPRPTPYEHIGGRPAVVALVEAFYDVMEQSEPALARLHPLDHTGRVSRATRDRFALFLMGWLGGPDDYVARYGHPRLRRRHAHVPIDSSMRDAWLRAMGTAMRARALDPATQSWLEARFFEVADFLRNRSD